MKTIEIRAVLVTLTLAAAGTGLLACSDAPPPADPTGTSSAAATKTPTGGGTAAEYVPSAGTESDLITGKKPKVEPFEHKPLTSTTTVCVKTNVAKVSFLRSGELEREVTQSCFPYLCDGGGGVFGNIGRTPTNTCTSTCTADTDCSAGAGCVAGACVVRAAYCPKSSPDSDVGGTMAYNTVDGPESCGRYRCSIATGGCFKRCADVRDCAPGYGCANGQCLTADEVNEG